MMPRTDSVTYRSYSEFKVKLRKFKAGSNVRAWFEIAESEFRERNTSEADKFTALVSSLEDDVYESMCGAIVGIPRANRYQALKSLLVEHYSLTRGQELRKLLSGLSIQGKKPSRLLAEMRSLAGSGRIDDEDLKTLFLEYLPNDVRMTLQVVPGDVNALATVADKIMEHRPTVDNRELMAAKKSDGNNEIAAVGKTENDSNNILAELVKRMSRLEARLKPTFRSRSRSRTNSRSRDSSRNQTRGTKICFYHSRFGAKAKKCTEPCEWQKDKEDKQTGN